MIRQGWIDPGDALAGSLPREQPTLMLAPAGAVWGVDIPHGVYHTVLALEAGK